MRVLVCGGRQYWDVQHVYNTLTDIDDKRGPITCIIHGGAGGADHHGMMWGQLVAHTAKRKIAVRGFTADWGRYGDAAGPIRNALMLEDGKPDLVVAFPGGKGTASMVKLAKYAGVEVMKVSSRPPSHHGDNGERE